MKKIMALVVLIALIVLVVVLGVFKFSEIAVFGWFMDWRGKEVVNKINVYELNEYSRDKNMLWAEDMPYIATLPFPHLGAKYYIKNLGTVPIWSKEHKIIDAYFKSLKS